VAALVRLCRDYPILTCEQVIHTIAKVSPQIDEDERPAVLRALVNADILQPVSRSDDLQINSYVLEFVRGLTREHELGLTAVLQARVVAIRESTESLNAGMQANDMDRVRGSASQLAEFFRQISLQLEQDRHAILDLAENVKSADSQMPITQRYRRVLEAFDHYVEPMNQLMDTGPHGSFYRYLEEAERALDLAGEQLAIQGALYSHRLQLRQVAHQAKELRRFGRIVAQQCADTLLPLREELRQHNTRSSAVSHLLMQVRKRGLRRTFHTSKTHSDLPLWRNERQTKVFIGDEVRTIMAAVRNYQPQSIRFPYDDETYTESTIEVVNEKAIRQHLQASVPVDSLLDWLIAHYNHLQDATLLRIFYDLQNEPMWEFQSAAAMRVSDMKTLLIQHYPQRIEIPV
jgi:hypothetical protein